MPITQTRFLSVVQGGLTLVDFVNRLRQAAGNNAVDIMMANSVCDHTTDQAAKNVIIQLQTKLILVENLIKEIDQSIPMIIGNLIAEQKYFARAAKANERAADKQRQKRREQGITPREQYSNPSNTYKPDLGISPTFNYTPSVPNESRNPFPAPILQKSTEEQESIRQKEIDETKQNTNTDIRPIYTEATSIRETRNLILRQIAHMTPEERAKIIEANIEIFAEIFDGDEYDIKAEAKRIAEELNQQTSVVNFPRRGKKLSDDVISSSKPNNNELNAPPDLSGDLL